MVEPRNSPSTVGIRSIQDRIRAMNETLDHVEQLHKKDTSTLVEPKPFDPLDGSIGLEDMNAPLNSSPVVKRSSVVDLWRMRESQNSCKGGVALNSVSKKKASISEETFRSLLKSPGESSCGMNHVNVVDSSPMMSSTSPKSSEEKKDDDDCVIQNTASSVSLYENRSPSRITSSSSVLTPKVPVIKRPVPHLSQPAPHSDLTILPATSSLPSTSTVGPEKRTSKIASMWEKMSNSSFDNSSGNALRPQPSDEERMSLASGVDSTSLEIKESSPPKRHSVVDIWNNRNISKSVNTAPKPSVKPVASTYSPQRMPHEPSTAVAPNLVPVSPPKASMSDSSDILVKREEEGIQEVDMDVGDNADSGTSHAYQESGQNDIVLGLAQNSLNPIEPRSFSASSDSRHVVDHNKFPATSVPSPSDMKTISPVVTSIVKDHASRTPIGTYINSRGLRGNEFNPHLSHIAENKETNSSVAATRTAIESAVTSVVDKHIEQRGNKISDRLTLNKVSSSESKKFPSDTMDLPKTRGKVTDRWKPHSSSVSDSGNKFDKSTVAELLKLHAGNTPFGKSRLVKGNADEPCVLQKTSPRPDDCVTPSSNFLQEPMASLTLSSHQVQENESISKMAYIASSPYKEDTTSTIVSVVKPDANPSSANQELEGISKHGSNVNVADRWKKRLDDPKGGNHKQGSNNMDEKTLSEGNGKVTLPSPVKPSLSVVDYAAKLRRSNRVPPSCSPGDNVEIVENVPLSTPNRIEDAINPDLISSINLADDSYQNDSSRVTQSPSVNTDIRSNKTNLYNPDVGASSKGMRGSIVKSTNSSAFAPWNNATEMSAEGNFSNDVTSRFTSQEVKNIGSPTLHVAKTTKTDFSRTGQSSQQRLHSSKEVRSTLSNPKTQNTIDGHLSTNVSTRQPISLSTKKLASDRALNKKRLHQYRGKIKSATITKISTSEDSRHTDSSRRDISVERKVDNDINFDEIQSGQEKGPFDFERLLRAPGSDSEHFNKPNVDDVAFAAICSTSSTTSSSPLASKAEKMLQDRRKRSNGRHQKSTEDPVHSSIPRSNMFNCYYDINVPEDVGASCSDNFPEDITEDGQPRLCTRYNTSSRFMDIETPETTPAKSAYDSETVDSSFNETETTGSHSGYYGVKRQQVKEKKKALKRRKVPVKDPPGQMSDEKSVNLSSQSAWESDWGGSVNFDFNKIASVVDEQVAAFRDFVGVGSKKQSKQTKKKSHLRVPPSAKAPTEVEDVAIEVEYVEDSFDDDDPRVDLGFCTAPIDDVVRGSLDFSNQAKASISSRFSEPCRGMLPTGEPSYEHKPNTRNQSHRNGYV